MSTPRDRGLVDEIYALQQAAAAWGDTQTISDVHDLVLDVQNTWLPVFSSTAQLARANELGLRIQNATGTNPLDVDDPTPWAGVGSQQQNDVASGNLDANIAAAGQDLAVSAGELGTTIYTAVGGAVTPVLTGVVVIAVVLVVLVVVAKT